jgi:hypothetical protein
MRTMTAKPQWNHVCWCPKRRQSATGDSNSGDVPPGHNRAMDGQSPCELPSQQVECGSESNGHFEGVW